MPRIGRLPSSAPRRLPALYLSCRETAGELRRPVPLMTRLLATAESVDALVFITSQEARNVIQLRCARPDVSLVAELLSVLEGFGYTPALHSGHEGMLTNLAAQLFAESPPCIVELRLGAGMSAGEYRQLGERLYRWRERQIMLICVDQVPSEVDPQQHRGPHDPYWRGLLSQWVEERAWVDALSDSAVGVAPSLSSGERDLINDTTLCLLHAAFGLGGLRAPERLFGFDLDDQQHALSGYGWIG